MPVSDRIKRLQNTFFFVLLALVTLAFFGLLRDFLQPMFWAAVLAVLFYPVHRRWRDRAGGRASVGALLTLLTIVVIVLLPLFLVGMAVTREASRLYEQVATGAIDLEAALAYGQRQVPLLTDTLAGFGVEVERLQAGLADAAVSVSRFVASQALAIGQDAARFLGLLFLMLYLLFFFLRDGERMVAGLIRALPLGDDRERRLLAKFAEVSRATIKGTIVVGVVQGTLGGLLFWLLGLDAPVFWGVLMTFLSLLPAVGAALIWLPAAIILMATGAVGKGIIMILAGTLVIGLVDNVLRPVLVGRDTKMPDYVILLSTLGGLAVFGLSGFVLGPIIAALFLVVWDMFQEEYADQDDPQVVAPVPRAVAPLEAPASQEATPQQAPVAVGTQAEDAVPPASGPPPTESPIIQPPTTQPLPTEPPGRRAA